MGEGNFLQKCNRIKKENGYSKKRMAEICGVSVASINKLENNIIPQNMTLDIVVRLQKHFGIKASSLFSPVENAQVNTKTNI